jgi:hypothetical protein
VGRIGGHRRACRHGFQNHQAEGVGPAGEDEDVRVAETARQLLAEAGAEEFGLRILLLQLGARRAIADHDLGAGQVLFEEGFDVLLDRHPADVEEEGSRPVLAAQLVIDARQVGVELLGVHAPGPRRNVAETVRRQLVAKGRGGDHQPSRRLVEPLHIGVADLHRDRESGRHVLGEFRMVAGRERQLPFHADAARGDADGAFGGDVHRLGFEGAQPFADFLFRAQGQPDLRIGGAGDGLELARLDDLDLMAHGPAFRRDPGQGADDAVDLGLPGVGGQNDAHVAGRLRR